MNLLPHKSWNVWSKKNMDKVKADEEKAKDEEGKKRKRGIDIEQEKRYSQLKDRIKRREIEQDNLGEKPDVPSVDERKGEKDAKEEVPLKHINFFEELEQFEEQQRLTSIAAGGSKLMASTKAGGNPEVEAEKKAADDRFTVYLGQGSEASKPKPWYQSSSSTSEAASADKQKRIEKRKEALDPLNEMNQFLSEKRKKDQQNIKKEKEIKAKKSVDDLRKDRLERERVERERVAAIMGTSRPAPKQPEKPNGYTVRYSNQFNPKIAKQNYS